MGWVGTQNVFFVLTDFWKRLEALQLACQDDQCGFFDTGVAEHGQGSRYSSVVDTAWRGTVLVVTLYTL